MASTTEKPTYPHAPALGLSRRLLGRFHVTGDFWVRFPYRGFRVMPLWADPFNVFFLTTFFFVTMGRIRRAIASNLDAVLGPTSLRKRWRRAYRTMNAFAWCMLERYRSLYLTGRFRFILEGEENWRPILEAGRGMVLVTAHIGFWEVAARFGADAEKRRIHVVREAEIDHRAQEVVREIVALSGENCVTHFAGDDPTLSLELAEALRNGEIVAFQADRPRGGGRTVEARLFGRPMPLPVGPAALARAAGVPLVPVFNFREGPSLLRAVIRPAIHVARTSERQTDIADAVHRVAAEIEWAIRERPHQWFCFRKLW